MPKLYLMLGLPGAGKSTYVNKMAAEGVQVVCPDNIRLAFGHFFHGPLEPMVHAFAYTTARALMARGFDVVIDEAHSRAEYIRRWRHAASEFNYEVVGLHVTTSKETCLSRRDDGMFPLDVISKKDMQLQRDLPAIIELLDEYVTIDGEDA